MTGTDIARVTPRLLETFREQLAPGASDEELAYFGGVCNRLGLSPFADQIVLIPRWDSRVKRNVFRHQLTVAGRRTLATRTGLLAGIEGPVWCGPRDQRGELLWREVWDEDGPPYCARVLVHVHGWTVAANGTAKWSEFVQTDKDGNPLPLWRSMPAHMLGKVAESLALRRAFPDAIPAEVADGFADLQAQYPERDNPVLAEVVATSESRPLDVGRFVDACRQHDIDPADVLAHAQIDRPIEQLTADDRPALAESLSALAAKIADDR